MTNRQNQHFTRVQAISQSVTEETLNSRIRKMKIKPRTICNLISIRLAEIIKSDDAKKRRVVQSLQKE